LEVTKAEIGLPIPLEQNAVPAQEVVGWRFKNTFAARFASGPHLCKSPVWGLAFALDAETTMLREQDEAVVLKLLEPLPDGRMAALKLLLSVPIGQKSPIAPFRDTPLEADIERSGAVGRGPPCRAVDSRDQ
jgi:hypothetical protein